MEKEFEDKSVIIICESGDLKSKDKKASIISKIAIVLIILSFVFYGLIPLIPFLSLTTIQKTIAVTILILTGEITWWIGVAMVGKKMVMKYKKYFNPCTWFPCSKKLENNEY